MQQNPRQACFEIEFETQLFTEGCFQQRNGNRGCEAQRENFQVLASIMSSEGDLHRRPLGAVRGFFSRSHSSRDCQTAAATALLLACGALLLVDIRGVQVSPMVSQVAKGLQPRPTASTTSRIVRLPLVNFLDQSCSDVAAEHEELVMTYLRPWPDVKLFSNNTDSWPTGRLYISNDSVYLHRDLEEEQLVPIYLSQLEVPP